MEQYKEKVNYVLAWFCLAYVVFSIVSIVFYMHVRRHKDEIRDLWRLMFKGCLSAHRRRLLHRWRRILWKVRACQPRSASAPRSRCRGPTASSPKS